MNLASVLSEFDCRGDNVSPVGDSAGFSGAEVWRVDGEWALRSTALPAVSLDRLRGLHRLLTWTSRRGISHVPQPRVARSGATFLIRNETVWQMERWMPGTADFRHSPTQARLVSAMHALARFHRAAAEFVPLPEERPWFFQDWGTSPGLLERFKHLKRWDDAARHAARAAISKLDWHEFRDLGLTILQLFERHAPRIANLLLSVRDLELPLQPCLRDVWHDHLLFTGDVLTGLIDPHACRSDCVATDLARCLGSLLGDDRPAWDFALQAYQEVRPLTINERACVELFDQSAVLLNGLTWLDWVAFRGRTFPNRERVQARLLEIVIRMERL